MRTTVMAAVAGGVIASIVDIGVAAIINHVAPDVVLRAIARGLIGPRAMGGGSSAAALGFGLQVLMGALIGAIFGAASTRFPGLVSRWPLAGLTFGAAVFVVMEFVVVPLSAVGEFPHFTLVSFVLNVAAMLIFGLIVAFTTQATSRPT